MTSYVWARGFESPEKAAQSHCCSLCPLNCVSQTPGWAGSSSPVDAWANMSPHQLHPGKLPKGFVVHQRTVSFASEL